MDAKKEWVSKSNEKGTLLSLFWNLSSFQIKHSFYDKLVLRPESLAHHLSVLSTSHNILHLEKENHGVMDTVLSSKWQTSLTMTNQRFRKHRIYSWPSADYLMEELKCNLIVVYGISSISWLLLVFKKIKNIILKSNMCAKWNKASVIFLLLSLNYVGTVVYKR